MSYHYPPVHDYPSITLALKLTQVTKTICLIKKASIKTWSKPVILTILHDGPRKTRLDLLTCLHNTGTCCAEASTATQFAQCCQCPICSYFWRFAHNSAAGANSSSVCAPCPSGSYSKSGCLCTQYKPYIRSSL